MKRTLSLFSVALLLAACGGSDTPTDDSPAETVVDAISTHRETPTEPGKDSTASDADQSENGNVSPRKAEEPVRLVVSFISQGEGIDLKTKGTFDTWLKSKGNISHDEQSWGREGEVNYCFALENLSPNEQDKFVEEVRAQLVGRNSLVRISENARCNQ